MASASSTARQSFNFPATFTVTTQPTKGAAESYTVTFSNKTPATGRLNPRNTFANVQENKADSSSVRQAITVTANDIFCRMKTSAIKFMDKSFTLLTGEEQLQALGEAANETRTIFVDANFPMRIILTTKDPRDTNLTITRFISESLAPVATPSAPTQTATTSTASLATDDAISRQPNAKTRSTTGDLLSSSSDGTILPKNQLSGDSSGDEVTFHKPTDELSPSYPKEKDKSEDRFTPPPPPVNSATDSSSYFTSGLPATSSEAAAGCDLNNLPPPIPELLSEQNLKNEDD